MKGDKTKGGDGGVSLKRDFMDMKKGRADLGGNNPAPLKEGDVSDITSRVYSNRGGDKRKGGGFHEERRKNSHALVVVYLCHGPVGVGGRAE
jgi:hypothetical protein